MGQSSVRIRTGCTESLGQCDAVRESASYMRCADGNGLTRRRIGKICIETRRGPRCQGMEEGKRGLCEYRSRVAEKNDAHCKRARRAPARRSVCFNQCDCRPPLQLDAHMSLLIALALSTAAVAVDYSYSAPTECDPFTVKYSSKGLAARANRHSPPRSRRRAPVHPPTQCGTRPEVRS